MTPKEARSLIRYEIQIRREEQIAYKKELSQPHTPSTRETMSRAMANAASLTSFHNALNELCGRKLSHEYHDKSIYHYDGDAKVRIKEIRAQIVWPVKPQATA